MRQSATFLQDVTNLSRIFTNTKKVELITPALEALHWASCVSMDTFKNPITIMQSGFEPKYISDLLVRNPRRIHNILGQVLLGVVSLEQYQAR